MRRRRFAHDDLVAVDLFSGFGGLTQGINRAGYTTIAAANHNRYKVAVHEANHPEAEHWIADLVDPESSDYHSARDLPRADLLTGGVSCVNHSQANTKKAYRQGLSLFDLDDPDFEAAVTRSERDRATANCILHYAAHHHPRVILVECTTELSSWGPALPGKSKIGDGSTYRWWLKQFVNLGYRYRVCYLNSMFFGVPQSRDRLYIALWDNKIPTPDLDHRPASWCSHCDAVVEAVWTWRTGLPPTGRVAYGKQYDYRCPSCKGIVVPPMTPSLAAMDLTDLGTRIGDRAKPLADSTMARAERCRQRFADFPAILMPAKAVHGIERHPWQPMATQTSQQETAILSTGALITSTPQKAVLLAVANFQGSPRGADEPLPTQAGSETLGIMSSGVLPLRRSAAPASPAEAMPTVTGSETLGIMSNGILPFRRNTVPTSHAEAMPTVTSEQIPGLLTAAGFIKNNGPIGEAHYRSHPFTDPFGTMVGSAITQGALFSGWLDATSGGAPALADWRAILAETKLEDCYFRMLASHEIGRGCGFDVDFGDHAGSFKVWGSARAQTDGFGNAVSPPVGEWLCTRLRAALHRAGELGAS
jgi:DNA (cytosine-5)-methyltransferase 1